jgi:hypothetical protein
MSNRQERLARERAVLKYCAALESGDLDLIGSVLQAAETDPLLEEMIREVHQEVRGAERRTEEHAAIERVRVLLHEYLPSAIEVAEEQEVENLPLTVGDVLGKMRTDALVGPEARQAAELAAKPGPHQTPLPDDLSKPGVRHLFQQLGLSVTRQFLDLFRKTAIQLELRREQKVLRLAATRRQSSSNHAPDPEEQEKPQ